MREVHIYAETDTKAFESRERMVGYLLEVILPNGKPATKAEFYQTTGTYNEVILDALVKALERMKEKCELHLHTHNTFVLGTIDGPNLSLWEKTGYRNAKGEKIKCAELWERFAKGITGNLIATEAGSHSYYNWMITEMKRLKPEDPVEGPGKEIKIRIWDHRLVAPKHVEMRA